MAFSRPTLSEIVDRVQSDFVSRLELVGAVLRRATVYVLTRVMAGAAHMLHGHLEFLGQQLFPDTSIDEFLVRQAGLFGITKTPAVFAEVIVQFVGDNGTVIPAGTVLVSSAGLEYTVDDPVTISSGDALATATASEAGAASSVTVGVVLALQSPITGVSGNNATVTDVTQDGVDVEDQEALRSRLLAHLAEPAMGGNEADYLEWTKEVPGVTRVWVSPKGLGPGTVVVRFTRDGDLSPIPDSGEVAAVQAKLDELAPVHATVTAFAPAATPLNFVFSMVAPVTAAVKSAVEAELADMVFRLADPRGFTLKLSVIRTTIGGAEGVTDYTLTSPSADVVFTANQLPTMGTVTWP